MKVFNLPSLIFNFLFFRAQCDDYIDITTETSGTIKGRIVVTDKGNFSTFLAIPYAKQPVANLRFKISDPTTYAIMVWIHGGGFIAGSARDYPVLGTLRNIVSRGVVFVSINYRLSTLGFFSTKTSSAPGNYGLLDQVQALKWVQSNIKYFGGDPTKVTIFGESAGGASVSFLTVTPLTSGLFHQAILMSGSSLSPWAMHFDSDPNDVSQKLAEGLGCAKSAFHEEISPKCPYRNITQNNFSNEEVRKRQREVKCLRAKKLKDLVSDKWIIYSSLMRPRVDGNVLPHLPEVLMKTRSPFNLMMGVTKDEYATFAFPGSLVEAEKEFYNAPTTITCQEFKFPDTVNYTLLYTYAHYPTNDTVGLDEKHFWFQQYLKLNSGLWFWAPVFKDALAALNTGSKIYMYSYDYNKAGGFYDKRTNFSWTGAPHGADLIPLFGGDVDVSTVFSTSKSLRFSRTKETFKIIQEFFGNLWTNFAKFGNPTPNGTKWVPFTVNETNYLSIDVPQIRMKRNFYENDMNLWTTFVNGLQNSIVCQ